MTQPARNLLRRLQEAGSTGLDLSPGDPLAQEAYEACREFVRMQHDIASLLGVDADTDSIDLHYRIYSELSRRAARRALPDDRGVTITRITAPETRVICTQCGGKKWFGEVPCSACNAMGESTVVEKRTHPTICGRHGAIIESGCPDCEAALDERLARVE